MPSADDIQYLVQAGWKPAVRIAGFQPALFLSREGVEQERVWITNRTNLHEWGHFRTGLQGRQDKFESRASVPLTEIDEREEDIKNS